MARCCVCVANGKCVRCACVRSNKPCYPSKKGNCENSPPVGSSSGTDIRVHASAGGTTSWSR